MTNQNNAAQAAQQHPIDEAIVILTEEADSLSECHTRTPGDWAGEPEAKARYDHILAVVDALSKLRAPVAKPAPEHFKPPFDNCSFRMCDLPGQCRGEGKCHHPASAPVADERAAFEAWAKGKKMPLARIGQQYDDFWVDHAWNGWQARAALDAPAAGDALDAARWRAYAAQFPEISAAFLAMHDADPLPTIKGAAITGGYVVVTPAGWDADKAVKLRDAILRLFPVNPVHTPRPSDELAAQRKGDA